MNAMPHLTRKDLYSLEEYAQVRPEFRRRVMEHKKNRVVQVGPDATLHFEDALTMQYQIQEMLRIERTFEPEGIQDELDVYNPLIPDGTNLKATFMIEYPDVEVRRRRLRELKGIEDKVWIQIGDHEKVYAIANEDLERTNEEKTSSVHFLRFEFTPEMIEDAKKGAPIRVGIEHPGYAHETVVPENVRESLVKDFA